MLKVKKFLPFVFLLCVGFILGLISSEKIKDLSVKKIPFDPTRLEKRESGYTFINPLLECEYLANQGELSLKNIKDKIEKIVENYPKESVSIYYRDLLNGPWYGVNEDGQFAPQSLLKLPVAISYFKYAEKDPSILSKKINIEKISGSNLKPNDDLIVGQEYEILVLIERAIVMSDNVAFKLLVSNIPEEQIKKTHSDLEIAYPSSETPENFISVKAYSSLFRVLYNSSYLSRDYSEKLLDMLSRAEFKNGLVAGVPKDIPVAHKFGLRNDTSAIKQLHDCGVIYYPKQPYILCVMTSGEDLDELGNTIKNISSGIYKAVSED